MANKKVSQMKTKNALAQDENSNQKSNRLKKLLIYIAILSPVIIFWCVQIFNSIRIVGGGSGIMMMEKIIAAIYLTLMTTHLLVMEIGMGLVTMKF